MTEPDAEDLDAETVATADRAHRVVPTPAPSRGAVPWAGGALRAIAAEAGLERVRIVAWRDLEDPEAGGSELHAHRIATFWARAGVDVELRTSSVAGKHEAVVRDGYRAVRRSGRYAVFGRTGWEGLCRPVPPGEGLVEIWNGMPFWSPLWYRGPRIVFLHHVHAEMWRMVLPRWMARIGEATERHLAPPLYRRTRVVTLSESSREEIVELLRLDPARVSVVPPGIDERFRPGPARCPHPLVVAVGRLVPVKRFDLLIRALAAAQAKVPDLRAAVVGEGYERHHLESLRRSLRAESWLELPGRVSDEELVGWYRRAWAVASASKREGWGMTLSEAGACGTPAVATDIAGHRDAVVHGQTGLLSSDERLATSLARVLADDALRRRLAAGARAHAACLSWEAAARATLEVLAEEVCWAARAAPRHYPVAVPADILQ